MIIGARELRDLALATAVVALFKDVPEKLCDMKSFWRHSLACGLTADLTKPHIENAIFNLFIQIFQFCLAFSLFC